MQGGGDTAALEAAISQEKRQRTDLEQRLAFTRNELDKSRQEEAAMRNDLMEYERTLAKNKLEIEKVSAVDQPYIICLSKNESSRKTLPVFQILQALINLYRSTVSDNCTMIGARNRIM